MNDADVQLVRDRPEPTCAKHVEHFVGLANYHSVFIKNVSMIATPLYEVTGKGQGTEECLFSSEKSII